jgi:hypothetical protein
MVAQKLKRAAGGGVPWHLLATAVVDDLRGIVVGKARRRQYVGGGASGTADGVSDRVSTAAIAPNQCRWRALFRPEAIPTAAADLIDVGWAMPRSSSIPSRSASVLWSGDSAKMSA